MSLHDVDKSGLDRSVPQPNHNDQVPQEANKSHGTNSVNYVTDSTDSTTNAPIKLGMARMVKSGTVLLVSDGSNLTTNTSAHGLGYAPLIQAYVNNATVTGIGNPVNLPLPLYLNATIAGGNVNFQSWLFPLVDATNVYFQLANSTGSPISVLITYYLYQQTAV